MKYKIGDKVRVKKDLEPGNFYGKGYYISSMDKFKGEKCVITEIWDQSYQINNFGYWWSEEMFESIDDDLLEYALEKLGMTKNELQDKMDRDKEDIAFIKKCMNDKKEVRKYCHRFELGCCDSCKIWKFKNKYKNKDDDVYEYLTDVTCNDVYKYLKEKGEI